MNKKSKTQTSPTSSLLTIWSDSLDMACMYIIPNTLITPEERTWLEQAHSGEIGAGELTAENNNEAALDQVLHRLNL